MLACRIAVASSTVLMDVSSVHLRLDETIRQPRHCDKLARARPNSSCPNQPDSPPHGVLSLHEYRSTIGDA